MMRTRSIASLAAIAALAFTAAPALATPITFDGSNVGTAYTLNYNGYELLNGVTTTYDGLSAQTTFTLTNISNGVFTFDYSVSNTSTAPITASRVTSFGFNSNPDIASVGATGTFQYTGTNANFANGVGNVEVCFKNVSTGTCSGNGGGLDMGQSGSGTFTLTYASGTSSISLGEFFVRYQGIFGPCDNCSASGTGTQTSSGTSVPEPGMLGLLGSALIATALLRRRRRPAGRGPTPAFA